MSGTLRLIYLLALIVWLGEVVCLSFVVAPTLFRTFAVEEAGRAVSALFPIYYRIGGIAGVVLLASAVAIRFQAGGRAWTIVVITTAVMLAATLYAGLVVQPRAQALRPQLHAADVPAAVKTEFDHLHRLAVQLNGVVFLGGVTVAALTAFNLKP